MMKYFEFLSFLLFNSLYYSTLSLAIQYSCACDHSLLLLAFKESLNIKQYSSNPLHYSSPCPKTMSWNKSTNFYNWDEVTCDKITSNVINLDLSYSELDGSIDSNSSLFRQSHLRRLNLALNYLRGSQISMIFEHLSPAKLEPLRLIGNLQLCGLLLSVRWNSYRTLEWLDLSDIKFLGEIPDSIGNIKALKYLNLLYCGFSGTIKSAMLLSLSSLQGLQLSKNQLSGSVPKELSSLVNLWFLYLDNNKLSRPVPKELLSLVHLESIYLQSNNFSGHVDVGIF
ncbi:hypothetical protein LIER_34790 [Lithospermum erythrorhizon]|uniref:Uncharacterized protein n=1 Tax=Lithospermum erythrorhizon TaxID=34254 RepID=A0AAV3S3S5_LITER